MIAILVFALWVMFLLGFVAGAFWGSRNIQPVQCPQWLVDHISHQSRS